MRILFNLLVFSLLCLYSCKKEVSYESLSNVILKKEGLLRVECNRCEIKYHVDNEMFSFNVNNGSNDIPFYYLNDFDLKIRVASMEKQNIRLLVIDSFGRIVSNELTECLSGQILNDTFAININKPIKP